MRLGGGGRNRPKRSADAQGVRGAVRLVAVGGVKRKGVNQGVGVCVPAWGVVGVLGGGDCKGGGLRLSPVYLGEAKYRKKKGDVKSKEAFGRQRGKVQGGGRKV